MESSFNAVELRELRGGGARRGAPTSPTSSPWTAATVSGATRGFDNASYQQDEEQTHGQQQQGAAVSSGNNKAGLCRAVV